MSITSPQIHNDLVLELTEMLFEVSDGPDPSVLVVLESMAVRIIILCVKENPQIDKKLLLNTFLNGIKQRVMAEKVIEFNA